VKHVKSNAVVFASADGTLAIGGGATSRVDAIHQAREKAARVGYRPARIGARERRVLPVPRRPRGGRGRGATAFVQPGGSVRDDEVIAAADRLGAAMVFTGKRHFRH
jgi:phosphoribosylaminoimidazolecarboxamide formyltransferase/IMP cyclohydrolase